MAAITAQFQQVTPNAGVKCVAFGGTSAANNDTLAVDGLALVLGCIGHSTTGVPMAYTITGGSNVITIVNGGALSWVGLAWGS